MKKIYNIKFDTDTDQIITTIPESLNTHLQTLNLKPNLLHKIYVFVSILIYYSLNKKYKNNFIPIHSKTIEKLFSVYYKQFIKQLQQLQIIQINNQYLTSKDHPLTAISKKYKLYSNYLNSPLIQVSFTDIKLTKRLNKLYSLINTSGGECEAGYKSYKQLTKNKLKEVFSNSLFPYSKFDIYNQNQNNNNIIDKSTIVTDAKYDNLLYHLNSIEFDTSAAKLYLQKNINKLNIKQINNITYIINFFVNKQKRQIKQCKAGRLFSIITLMPKVLRQFLYLTNSEGEKENLVILDISNFQPYILNKYLKYYNLSNNKDFKLWYKLTSKGDIYQYLVNLYNKQKNINKINKKVLKQRLVSIINSQIPDTSKQTILYKLLSNKFPSIIQLFNQIKKDDYKQMSYLLQQFESDIMINQIAIPYSQFFILTIHDGVIIKEQDVNTYKRYIFKAFNKHFQSLPSLKQTTLGGDVLADVKFDKRNYKQKNINKQTIKNNYKHKHKYKYKYNNNFLYYRYKTKEDYVYSHNYLHNILYNQVSA